MAIDPRRNSLGDLLGSVLGRVVTCLPTAGYLEGRDIPPAPVAHTLVEHQLGDPSKVIRSFGVEVLPASQAS
jgi:hypothetical protein